MATIDEAAASASPRTWRKVVDKKKQVLATHPYIEGSILVDLSFRPIAADRGAQTLINTLGARAEAREPARCLPQDLLHALQDLSLDDLADAEAHFQIGTIGYLCRVTVMNPCGAASAQPVLALYIQKNPDGNQAMREIADRFDLTEREYEALVNIASGLSAKEIAERMKISPNTVKAFLRLIMIKMGVTRRGGILSKVLELTRNNGKAGRNGSPHE
ncbi:MAG: response regulator transcription factor [Bryobacterales bacterium]|nr:response regulator transcription factor [Bryobacterales bacterium]